jgi:hypothetical protein
LKRRGMLVLVYKRHLLLTFPLQEAFSSVMGLKGIIF